MAKIKFLSLIFFSTILISSNLWAYSIGLSSYPIKINKKRISTEFTSVISSGGGLGLQGRYVQKLTRTILLDGGLGVAGGTKGTSRAFVGADFEIFPDYMKQPRFSIKTTFENSKEKEGRQNILSLTPIFSKKLNMRRQSAYPYIAVPFGLKLNNSSKTYETCVNFSVGINGKLPLKRYKDLTYNLEGTLTLRNSYSGLFLGVSYPIN